MDVFVFRLGSVLRSGRGLLLSSAGKKKKLGVALVATVGFFIYLQGALFGEVWAVVWCANAWEMSRKGAYFGTVFAFNVEE